jgi:hypothetical protein
MITARNFILEFLNRKYGVEFPTQNASWEQMDLLGESQKKSTAVKYTSGDFAVVITHPNVVPQERVFNITVSREAPEFSWSGLLNANGEIIELSIVKAQPSPTNTPIPAPSSTQIPTSTNTPPPTATASQTQTPAPTHTPTSTPDPCHWASFLGDITIPDGTSFTPGTDFIKIWRIKNVGSCTWTPDYDLVFVRGDRLDGLRTVPLPENVRPGESVDLSVELRAPQRVGDYRGFWMLRTPEGIEFGLGLAANQTFWVSISVLESIGDYRYDFAPNLCAAVWRSENGRLSCAYTVENPDGFVRLLENPNLEIGSDNEAALWLHPNERQFGWINGNYPYFKVSNGDHFKSIVGCLDGYDRCNVTFYLDYEDEDGRIIHLGRWQEFYDQNATTIDIDLSGLVGRTIRFILGMEANTQAVEDAQGFWLVPRIEKEPSAE